MANLLFVRARQDFCLDGAESVQDDSYRRPRSRVLGNALDRELSELGRTARVGKSAHFIRIDGEGRRGAGKVRVIRETAGGDFREDDAEGENVGGKIKLVAKEDLGRHVCVRAAECEAAGLFLVPGGDAGKPKVCDLEATILGDEQILAFQVAVDAFTRVKVRESTGNICCKRKSETPRQRLRFVVYVLTEVTCGEN
jgi:hypothetical protein